MKKWFIVIGITLCCVSQSFAANWFVRPNGGSYGTENGTSWTNAYDGFSDITWSSIAAGDTIWVAGGTYTQDLSPAKSGTSGSRIYIRRARADATECTSADGWNSSFDSTINHYHASIIANSYNYITISGATTSSGGTQGWLIDFTGLTSGTGIEWPNGATGSYWSINYIDIQGPGYITYSSDGRGIDATPFSSASHNDFNYCKIHDWESTVYLGGFNYATFDHCEFYNVRAVNSAVYHPNMIYMIDADYFTFRYNYVHGWIGEGIFWTNNDDAATGAYIYGNLFVNTKDGGSTTKVLQSDLENPPSSGNPGLLTDLHIYNNVFDNNYNVSYGDANFASSESYNNIITRNGSSSPFSGTGWTTGTNLVSSTGTGIFISLGTDYHIPSTIGAGYARNAGTNMSAQYTLDRDGVTFGGDGTWDIGAYEYTTGETDTTAPTVTISTADPSNISADTLAISGSASDAVGVTACKWRIGSAPDGSNGTALSGTTSWSGTATGFSSGANTLYAGCTDAAGNWGSDSMVVNYTPPSSFRVGPIGGTLSGGTIQ
jgi:hypothetical protein